MSKVLHNTRVISIFAMPEDLFKIQRFCLRAMGHKLDASMQILSRKRAMLYSALYYMQLLLVTSVQWPQLSYVKYNIDDLEMATAGVSVWATNFLSMVKIITFLHYKPKFCIVLQRISEFNEEMVDADAKVHLNAANKIAKRLTLVYSLSVMGTGIYFHVVPIVKIIGCALQQQPIPMETPMPIKLLFDHETSPGYEFAYCYIAVGTLIVVMYACAVDGLFFVFAMNISGHLKALQHFITTNLCHGGSIPPQLSNQNVSDLVQYHALILELAASVQEIFMPIVFFQFLMTSLNVCVVIYQMVSNLNSLMVMLNYATFLVAILWQLFIYCYGGEMLKEQSAMVSTAVKYSNWHELLPQQRRMLLFLIMRSQREVIIKAGFYEASLANFLTIIQAAISYITIIQSIE